jgi:hypothetical protein
MFEKLIEKYLGTHEGRRKLFRWFFIISLFMLILGYAIILILYLR